MNQSMDLNLSQEETALLERVLTHYLSDLRMEVSQTDNPEFKDGLKDEKATLEKIVSMLKGPQAGS